MEKKDTAPNKLFEIKIGTLVHADWTTILKKIRPLG